MHEYVIGEADLLVESFATLVAHVGPHATVRKAETITQLFSAHFCKLLVVN
jgi:hypothetical protein